MDCWGGGGWRKGGRRADGSNEEEEEEKDQGGRGGGGRQKKDGALAFNRHLPASHTVGIPVWCSLINRCVSQARCLMKGQGLWKEADMEEEEDVSRWAVGRGGDGEAEGSPVLHYSVPPEVERGTQRMLPQLYIHLWETIADGWGGGEGGGGGAGGGDGAGGERGGEIMKEL